MKLGESVSSKLRGVNCIQMAFMGRLEFKGGLLLICALAFLSFERLLNEKLFAAISVSHACLISLYIINIACTLTEFPGGRKEGSK